MKRIERRKRSYEKFKQKEKLKKESVAKAIKAKAHRKSVKANIVPVPANTKDEFIDTNIEVQENGISENANKNKANADGAIEGFTVLGGENFNKREKVFLPTVSACFHMSVISFR